MSIPPELPEELICQGKDLIEPLKPEFELYKRFQKKDLINEGGETRLDPARIELPNFSVNCGDFCQPEHVLFPYYAKWGVARFHVRDVPGPKSTYDQKGQETVYSFKAEHAPICTVKNPLEENYAHAEVRAYKNGEYSEKSHIKSSGVKVHFRLAISQAARIIIDSDI